MEKINAKIVGDSINKFGNRLTTFEVIYPRIIHSEFMTHRMLSKNSASSRAIPFNKMLKMVESNPFIPIAFQKDHKGMQGTQYFTGWREKVIKLAWISASKAAIFAAKKLNKLGVTKQLSNRLLECFMYHKVLVSGTEFENFFHLRSPVYIDTWGKSYRSYKDYHIGCGYTNDYKKYPTMEKLLINKGQAEIHIMALAEAMWDAYNESIPKELKAGEWHIPFGDNMNLTQLDNSIQPDHGKISGDALTDLKIQVATARCARVSYTVVGEEGKADNYNNDVKLHDRLAQSGHFSPFEHIGKAMSGDEIAQNALWCPEHIEYGWSGNFRGFIQYRKLLPNENKV